MGDNQEPVCPRCGSHNVTERTFGENMGCGLFFYVLILPVTHALSGSYPLWLGFVMAIVFSSLYIGILVLGTKLARKHECLDCGRKFA